MYAKIVEILGANSMAIYNESDKSKWTKDGRHWYFVCYKKDFNGVNKKYKSKKFLKKSDAEEAERLFLMKRDNPSNIEFDLVAKDYFNYLFTIRKDSTVYTYLNAFKNNIEPFFKHFYINEINVRTINEWKDSVQKNKFCVRYLNKMYNILKCIFDFAMKNYGLPTNPVVISGRFKEKNDQVIKDEEKIRYITYGQFQKFISVIDDIMWKTFFTFLYYTGMRKGEVLALNWNDIDFENKTISVNKTLYSKLKGKYTITSTKNNLNRKIKMSKTLIDQLLIYKQEVIKYDDFKSEWFVFGCSRYLALTNIDRYKDHYFKLANLEPITIHEFRHSHVSLLINEFVKSGQTDTTKFFLMMSERMGHSIQVMQKTYMHLFPTVQDQIVDLLNNL